jgi:nicotinate-nucleotide pyrophosphorylase (carboxylating)
VQYVTREFQQIEWDAAAIEDCRQLVRLAVREDLDRHHDWTTVSLVPEGTDGRAAVVAREALVVAGLPAAQLALAEMDPRAEWTPQVFDGAAVPAETTLALVQGEARSLLAAERIVLNLLGRLSGIATLTLRFVEAISGTKARIYDTRKTTPGWRRLEKYAVRCGGGHNHRTGLFDAVLIKDNHLALGRSAGLVASERSAGFTPTERAAGFTPAGAVRQAREFLRELFPDDPRGEMLIEVEVDTLAQFVEVLPAGPDIVLLDNMTLDQLREAVRLRDELAPQLELEASGGVRLETVRSIAETGVNRISAGALTHSAISSDVAMDWIT